MTWIFSFALMPSVLSVAKLTGPLDAVKFLSKS